MRNLKHLFMLCLFGMISIGASAETDSGKCGENAKWIFDTETQTLTITGTGAMYDYSTLEERNEKATYEKYGNTIKHVIINEGITRVGEFAFALHTRLASASLPEGLLSIGYGAFGDTGIMELTLPSTVEIIEGFFYSASNFNQQRLEGKLNISSIEQWLKICLSDNIARARGRDFGLYVNGEAITEITVPDTCQSIPNYLFAYITQLKKVIMPDVKSIGVDAFKGCKDLVDINLPNSVISIGENAFYGCNSLPIIDNIRYADTYLVEATDKTLSTYNIKEGTKWIGTRAFDGCKLTSIELPNSLISIGVQAFRNCTGLTSVEIPNSVTSIGDDAFHECFRLTSVYVEWKEAGKIPDFYYSNYFPFSTCDLYVPVGTKAIYQSKDYWKTFRNIIELEPNIIIGNADGTDGSIAAIVGGNVDLNDNIQSISIAEVIANVNVTYTRNFEKAGVWQAWYMPFDVAFDDMKDDYDVAQIHGVLLDKDNNAVIAFLKLDDGTVKANTPYVVRPKASGEVSIETTTDLQSTVSKSFDLKSATDIYYLGGVYEKTTTPGNWYALNLDGQFQKMGSGVYLRPFRIYMTIDPRTDNPYAQSASTTAKMDIVVIGDDEPTGINLTPALSQGEEAIYNLNGQRVTSITSGQIYIMNGKKYIAK